MKLKHVFGVLASFVILYEFTLMLVMKLEVLEGKLTLYQYDNPVSVPMIKIKQLQNLCQSTETACTRYEKIPTGVMVVGVLSFLGSRLAAHLVAEGLTVYGIASVTDTNLDGLVWYRRDQLVAAGVDVEIIDFKNLTMLNRTVMPHLDLPLVYVPFLNRSPEENLEMSEEMIGLLEMVQKWSNCTKVLMISDNTGLTTLQKVRLESLELLLFSYHSVYNIPIVVLRVGGVYGPWSNQGLLMHKLSEHMQVTQSQHNFCWYISDVEAIVFRQITKSSKNECEVLDLIEGCQLAQSTIQSSDLSQNQSENSSTSTATANWNRLELYQIDLNQLHTVEDGIKETLSWAKQYKSARENVSIRVIFTTYFTNYDDPQRGKRKRPNHFPYISEWYKSLVQLNMSAVIFHDGMEAQFQDKLIQYHAAISFEYVPSLNGHTTNDGRFYFYLNYLEKHPEIDKVLLTDISDVRFQMNPFTLMDLLGEWLYVGKDVDEFPTMNDMEWMRNGLFYCYGKPAVNNLLEMDSIFNAGVIGGSRELMLMLLTKVVGYLNICSPKKNCNMPAVNVALHRHFFDNVFTGFPLTSHLVWNQISPKGVYIIHK